MEAFRGVLGRDDLMGDKERFHSDGDVGRGVLHDPMHDATVDVYVCTPWQASSLLAVPCQPMSLRVMAVSPGTLTWWF